MTTEDDKRYWFALDEKRVPVIPPPAWPVVTAPLSEREERVYALLKEARRFLETDTHGHPVHIAHYVLKALNVYDDA